MQNQLDQQLFSKSLPIELYVQINDNFYYKSKKKPFEKGFLLLPIKLFIVGLLLPNELYTNICC